MNQKTRSICNHHINNGCRTCCPLAKACQTNIHESHATLADRMNEVSRKVKMKGFE